MASRRPPTAGDGDGFPIAPELSQTGRPSAPSVISSRLSDDGGETSEHRPKSGTSKRSGASRPETSKSKNPKTLNSEKSSSKDHAPDVSGADRRRANPAQPTTRTRNIASRSSHVPSLTSNAFFRPMSSQKLQAHRGSSRPATVYQQQPSATQHLVLDDAATDIGGSVVRHSMPPAPADGNNATSTDDGNIAVPPSRGTEVTEQDRVTFNTSPTGGHYPTGSLSDSVQPLHKEDETNSRNKLSINVGKSYQDTARNVPSPIKSPRSFRSSFLLSGRESSQGQNRNTVGAEKLSSGASSPKFTPRDRPTQLPPMQGNDDSNHGKVHQYFEGNTRFWFGGRWQNTRGRPINIATGFFIVLLCVLFFAFSAPWLWHNISPALPITFGYLFFVCMSSFIHASVSDPGVRHHPFSILVAF